MSGVCSWSVHDFPCPLGTQRQRQPLPVKIFITTDYPPGPPPGEGDMHLPSPEAVPSLSGSPVPRPLAPPLTPLLHLLAPRPGGAACLCLAQRHCFWRLRCGSAGGFRGPPSVTIFDDILYFYIYIILCCITYFALSIERTWPDLHFTTDYILYNWVCDE